MKLFPVRKPTIGLSFSANTLTSLEITSALWPSQQRTVRMLKREQLGPGYLRPSKEHENITDISALTRSLKALISPGRRTPVALSLPSQSAYLALLSFDKLPNDASERRAVIYWKLSKEHEIPVKDCRVEYRAFQGPGGQQSNSSSAHYVLAAAVRHSILDQYEQVCTEAGLLPTVVGIQGLQLFDLCRTLFDEAKESFFASFLDSHFFFIGFRGSCPIFIRSKPLISTTMLVRQALTSTFQFYDEVSASIARPGEVSEKLLYLLNEQPSDSPDFITPLSGTDSLFPNDRLVIESSHIKIHTIQKNSLPITWSHSDVPWTSGLHSLAALSA